jgi:hypothetical protein
MLLFCAPDQPIATACDRVGHLNPVRTVDLDAGEHLRVAVGVALVVDDGRSGRLADMLSTAAVRP